MAVHCEFCCEDGVSVEGVVLVERQQAIVKAIVRMGGNVQENNVCELHASCETLFPPRYTTFHNLETLVRVSSDAFQTLGNSARLKMEATQREDNIIAHTERVQLALLVGVDLNDLTSEQRATCVELVDTGVAEYVTTEHATTIERTQAVLVFA